MRKTSAYEEYDERVSTGVSGRREASKLLSHSECTVLFYYSENDA
jgi:hypothetical protein